MTGISIQKETAKYNKLNVQEESWEKRKGGSKTKFIYNIVFKYKHT
jgi:hypothetical protein